MPRETTNDAFWLVVPKELEAVSTTVLVPAGAFGTPLIRPFVAMERDEGRLEAPKIMGAEPLAVTVLLNVTPLVA